LRLFAVACCRRIAHFLGPDHVAPVIEQVNRFDTLGSGKALPPDYLLRVVEETERAAEGLINAEALEEASSQAYLLYLERDSFYASRDADEPIDMSFAVPSVAAEAVCQASNPALNPLRAAERAAGAVWLSHQNEDHDNPPPDADETAAQCALAR